MVSLKQQPDLADIQAFIKQICIERGWNERTPLEKMLFLTEEVGELAKAIRKESGIYGYKKPDDIEHLAEELIDVFNYVIDIANLYDVNMEEAFRAKWAKNSTRSWATESGKG